jgi:curved DNA-binding protein CbpA
MNPYRVLGIGRDAMLDEIHAAYRRRARSLHPDAGGTDVEEMARVNDAWRVLRDPARRAAYDTSSAVREPPSGQDSTQRDIHETGGSFPMFLRLLVISTLVLSMAVLVAIFLIGFGRVGATP